MIQRSRITLVAAIFGLHGVASGAFGAHALQSMIGIEALKWWETGVRYQLIHALLLLVVSVHSNMNVTMQKWTVRSLVGGILIFSGTLYMMALGAPRFLGAITPLGGLGLITSWALIGVDAWIGPHRDCAINRNEPP